MDARTPVEFFGSNVVGVDAFTRVRTALMASHPDVTVRVSRSQVAFRRRRGFAFLWSPGQYLHGPAAPVVHLEMASADDIDDEVTTWLKLAADEAGH
ncbi:MAG: hypothetical protein Q7V58_07225 [Actinomycetota bacterium]|nr:hypothetical protein [Actinomycetota bacterium]